MPTLYRGGAGAERLPPYGFAQLPHSIAAEADARSTIADPRPERMPWSGLDGSKSGPRRSCNVLPDRTYAARRCLAIRLSSWDPRLVQMHTRHRCRHMFSREFALALLIHRAVTPVSMARVPGNKVFDSPVSSSHTISFRVEGLVSRCLMMVDELPTRFRGPLHAEYIACAHLTRVSR